MARIKITQYRSGIYYYDDAQREAAENTKAMFQAELANARYGNKNEIPDRCHDQQSHNFIILLIHAMGTCKKITTTNHCNIFPLKERTVAMRAIRYAITNILFLTRHT